MTHHPLFAKTSRAFALGALTLLGGLTVTALPARAETIIDAWASVTPPAAPELKPVKIDPKTTAFLVLDIAKQTCTAERRPRCIASLPKIAAFLAEARKHNVMVVYSGVATGTMADTLPAVAPLGTEPFVASVANKFIRTDLDKILKERGITTVITVGTTAQGAVLFTSSEAAFLGYKVIVPVDGSSADSTYAEQYVAFTLTTSPGVGPNTTLTRFDMIGF